MSRRPAIFTQDDIARTIRAVEAVAPGRYMVEIDAAGVIRIRPREDAQQAASRPREPVAPPGGWRL